MENESRRSVDLRAPEEGTVSAVLVKPGQIVSAGQTIAMLLPDNAHLQARILLSSRAIGFIHTGQRVVLRYESFPWQKFGQHSGAVSEISTSPVTSGNRRYHRQYPDSGAALSGQGHAR